LDIVALKTIPCRGQAFVCFDDIQSATEAMKSLQGFPMFDTALVEQVDQKIQYAKSKSNAIKIKDGTILSRKVEKRFVDEDEDHDTRKKIKQMEEGF
jgi:RNA recognition motif-containing protein